MIALDIPRRSRSGELTALAALFTLTIRQHTHGRRLLVLGLLFLLPCILVMVLRNLPNTAPPEVLEFAFAFTLLPHGLVPLTALLYAAGVVSDDVEEQTLTYILLRSMPRWAIYITKLLATFVVTTTLVAIAIFALYVAIYAGTPGFTTDALPRASRVIAVMALAQVGYCSLFGFLGLFTKRSLVAGIAYIVAIEGILANLEFVGRSLTIVYYVRTLNLSWLNLSSEQLRRCQETWGMTDMEVLPTPRTCVLILLAFGGVVAMLSAQWFARREFRVKTPGSD
jgi:ABC-2 type transport system permease protein